MKINWNQFFKYLLGLTLGLFLFYLAFKDRTFQELSDSFRKADFRFVFAGLIVSLLSHYVRALRWQMLLSASGEKTRVTNVFAALMVGYMANNAVPRLGEVTRCTLLIRSDKVPIAVSIGTVLTERILDVLCLGILILIALFMESSAFFKFLGETGVFNKDYNWLPVVIGLIMAVIFLFLVIRFKKLILKSAIAKKVIVFAKSLTDSALGIFRLKNPILFIFYTILIWLLYILVYYVTFPSLLETSGNGFYFAMFIMIFGGIGMSMPVPGGIGPFHNAVILAFYLLGSTKIAGENFALLIHTSQFIMLCLVGLIAYIFLIFRSKMLEQPTR